MISVHLEFATLAECTAFFTGKTAAPMTPVAAAEHLKKVVDEAKTKTEPVKTEAKAEQKIEPAVLPTVTYDTYADAAGNLLSGTIAKLVAKDRNKAVAILTEMGVKKGPLLTAEQWPVAMEKFSTALAAAELS